MDFRFLVCGSWVPVGAWCWLWVLYWWGGGWLAVAFCCCLAGMAWLAEHAQVAERVCATFADGHYVVALERSWFAAWSWVVGAAGALA
jgi:hypothetical protein